LVYSGTTAYYLTADGGVYAVTGTAVGEKRGLKILSSGGSYLLVGTAAGLRIARKISSAGGSYAVSGTAATGRYARKLPLSGGSYVVTGTADALVAVRKLAMAGSSYAITGAVETMQRGLALLAALGSYSVTGGSQSYKYIRRIKLTLEGGVYTTTGENATLVYGFSGEERRWNITLYYPPGTILATGHMDSGLVPREMVTDTRDYDFDYCADPATLPVPLINYDVEYGPCRQPLIIRGVTNDPVTIETTLGRPICLTRRGIATTAMRMLGARDVWVEFRRDLTFTMVKADRTQIQGTYTVSGSYPAP
jgi:hypothetical protein